MAESEKLWIPDVGWMPENEVTMEQLEARLAKLTAASLAAAPKDESEA